MLDTEICSDVLKNISEEEVDKFLRILNTEWPLSSYAQGCLKTCQKWLQKEPTFNASLFSYRENFESGIFIGIIKSGCVNIQITVYALDGYENQLRHALLNTKKIDWQMFPIRIQGIVPKHTEIIDEVMKKKNLEKIIITHSSVQMLDLEKALNYEIRCPNEVYVAALREKDLDHIYDLWRFKNTYTKDHILYCIKQTFSFGVFSKTDDELLACVMGTHYGGIGRLSTKENFQRRGFAKLLVQIMAKRMAELNIQPLAMINESNFKSISMFKSLGFEPHCIVDLYNIL